MASSTNYKTQNQNSSNSILAPLKKLTTPGGLEWIYLMPAKDEAELEEIRRENQVHYNSYSAKSEWTKFVCTRNPTAQGNCKFGLLAMDLRNKPEMGNENRFHIYTRGTHNHQVNPIRPTPKPAPTNRTKRLESKPISPAQNTQIVQKSNANKSKQEMPIINKSNEFKPPNNLVPSTKQPQHKRSMEVRPNCFETRGKSLSIYNICHNFNDIESLRRSEGLLVDKQFNVVDGVPERVSYRCKIDSKCPFMLHALHNRERGFFELYAPDVNIHVHDEEKNSGMKAATNNSVIAKHCQHNSMQNNQDLPSNSGSGLNQKKPDNGFGDIGIKQFEEVKMEMDATEHAANINKQLNSITVQPKVKLLQNKIRRSRAHYSFPVNVKLDEWNYICDLQNESEFEQIRKNLRVVSLHQQGKLFSTVRQQTLKCYRRISRKGKCPYRILLFRENDGNTVKLYEKGQHNHFAPKIVFPSNSNQSTSSSSFMQTLDNGTFTSSAVQQNIANPINQFDMKNESDMPRTSSSNNEKLLRRVEETIGKMNSDLESTKEEQPQQNFQMEVEQPEQQDNNFDEEIFSIIDCQVKLQSLAQEFQLEFSIDGNSILFKKCEDDGVFIMVSEHHKCLNIDEYRNGTLNGQIERWIKGDRLQFIYAMRARIHEFVLGKHFAYGRRF